MEGKNPQIARGWMDFIRTQKPQPGLDHHGQTGPKPSEEPIGAPKLDGGSTAVNTGIRAVEGLDGLEEFKRLLNRPTR